MLGPVLLLASTCSFPDSRVCTFMVTDTEHAAVTVKDQQATRTYFNKIMFDGPAARWQFAYKRAPFVCGFVNGKNRYGAFTGWQPFYFNVDDQRGVVFTDQTDTWMWELLCLNISPPKADAKRR